MVPLVPRIRFSLRAFFLALIVLSLIGSNRYTAWKWHLAQQEIKRLRDELGVLTISDQTRYHVREMPTYEPFSWRWRIYVPPGDRSFCLATSGIAETGTHVGAFSSRARLPVEGEFTLAVRVERAQNGGWELAATYPGGRMALGIKPPYADWVFNGDAYPAVRPHRNNARYEVVGQKGKTESFGADEPLVLLRVRAPLPDQAANHQPCDGVMVWFDHVNPKNAH